MEIALIVHDIRSCHNVGSLLRTAEGLGVQHVYLTGYTPYPEAKDDTRLPHLRAKIGRQIHKTALGAEDTVAWSQHEDIHEILSTLHADGFELLALEQTTDSTPLHEFRTSKPRIALLIGREVEGIDVELLKLVDETLEIPMSGQKESFNVVQAAAMTLYYCRFLADS
jgi:23S rRNA (guanosine2251-2'-O)-methyltransferase